MQEHTGNVSREMEILRKKNEEEILELKKNTIAFAGFISDWPQQRKASLSLKA